MRAIIACSLPLYLLTAGGALADECIREVTLARKHVAAAQAAERQGDVNATFAAYSEAVAAEPENGLLRLQRAGFLHRILGRVIEDEQRDELRQIALDDYAAASELCPQHRIGSIARDQRNGLLGRVMFPEEALDCPEEAIVSYNQAELLYQRRQLTEAVEHYQAAAASCPDGAKIWLHHADAYYALNDYPRAIELFEKGLALEPWSRSGHRFLADAAARGGDLEKAYDHARLSVLSDPTYEAGWATLGEITRALDGSLRRIYAEKASVSHDGVDEEGDVQITISLPLGGEEEDEAAGEADGSAVEWTMYAISKAGTFIPETPDDEPLPAAEESDEASAETETIEVGVAAEASAAEQTPLERERRAVGETLVYVAEAGTVNPFWALIREADRLGYRDEAIFLHLIDEDLVPEYREYRDRHRQRLLDYLAEVVAPRGTDADG